jgi:TonB family protein
MTNHLSEDQISRWFIGKSSPSEQRHVQDCGECTAELGLFLDTIETFRVTVATRAAKLTEIASPNLNMVLRSESFSAAHLIEAPSLLVSLKRIIADTLYPAETRTSVAPVEVKEIWSRDEFRHTRWLSLVVHAVVLGLLIIPPAITNFRPAIETVVTLYKTPLILSSPRLDQEKGGGGGGGGRKALTPPSKGVPPRGADKQIVPPMVEAVNLAPRLVVESTIVAPDLNNVRPIDLQLGDPNGVVGPLSPGPGKGGGIGSGDGTGVGPGKGPGFGPGENGGSGGGIYGIGGGVTAPTVLSRVEPEYSDDARKSRIQGTVELVIIVQTDGRPKVESVESTPGYGLEQRAIAAVMQWRFTPGRKDGLPVPTRINVSVRFSLR